MTTNLKARVRRLIPEKISAKPNRDAVVAAIQHTAGCSAKEADQWLHWLQSTLGEMRNGETTHYLTPREMNRYHDILDSIIPDDTVATPGSAHMQVQDLVLDRSRGELSLTHSKEDGYDESDYCTVTLDVMRLDMG